MSRSPRIFRVAVTGGPCAGKTTAIAKVTERFSDLGFEVLVVPEVARMMIKGGLKPWAMTPEQLRAFQCELVQVQMRLEDAFVANAGQLNAGKPVLLLMDRGTMDGKAYLPLNAWSEMLRENEWTEAQLGDARYDGVLHLITAADGAEQFYAADLERMESLQEARDLDQRLRNAWTGHPHLRVIANGGTFDEKIQRAIRAISRIVGVPEPLEVERKFLLAGVPALERLPVHYEPINIEQRYLLGREGETERVRRRWRNDGGALYYHTVKQPVRNGERIEEEELISEQRYSELLRRVDPEREPVIKTRCTFLYKERYFELDIFQGRHSGLALLEVELDATAEEICLPPFLSIAKEVTSDAAYSNSEMARRSVAATTQKQRSTRLGLSSPLRSSQAPCARTEP
jgi:CYTH domain-containing protein/predicted ATPase